MKVADPTFETVALREAKQLGLTCASCVRWRINPKTDKPECELDREPNRICRDFDTVQRVRVDGGRE